MGGASKKWVERGARLFQRRAPAGLPQSTGGFALVAALGMLAFLVLLILSLSTLSQVEVHVQRGNQHAALARHQALFALDQAVALLEQQLGDDRSVSARADLHDSLDPAFGTALWTGAWAVVPADGEPAVEGPVWLVSGVRPDPRHVSEARRSGRATADDAVIALRSGDSTRLPIVAPLVAVDAGVGAESSGGNHMRYAFWIGDENLKVRPLGGGSENGQRPIPEHNSRHMFLRRPASVDSLLAPGADQRVVEPLLGKVQVRGQAALIEGVEIEALIAATDDYSWVSEGLPTDTVHGGWRRVIRPDRVSETLPEPFLSARRYLDVPRNFGVRASDGILQTEGNLAELEAGVQTATGFEGFHPVLTEVVVKCGVFHAANTRDIRVRFHIEFELYNPYTFPINLRHGESDHRPYDLVVTGLPRLLIENVNRATVLADLDLQHLRDHRHMHVPLIAWVDLSELVEGDAILLPPGEVVRVREPRQAQGLVRTLPAADRRVGPEDYGEEGDSIRIEVRFPADYRGTTFKLVRRSILEEGMDSNAEDAVVCAITGVPFLNDTLIVGTASQRFFLERSDDYTEEDYSFGFHFKLFDDPQARDGLAAFADTADLRRAVINFSDEPERFEVLSRHPGEIAIIDDFFSELDGFKSLGALGDSPLGSSASRDVRLYDIPDTDLWTFGELRHVPVEGKPPYAFGEPEGKGMNSLFDSSILVPPETVPWVRTAGEAGEGPDHAEGYRIVGAFNVNSTSLPAWRAMLVRGLKEYWIDRNATGGSDPHPIRAEAAFARHPFGASLLPDILPAELISSEAPFRQGLRLFEAHELEPLAEAIVARIRQAGPFPSMAAFFDRGILRDALEDAGVHLNNGFPPGSPGRIRQGDIAAALAPYIAVRSDTFVIRTYGDIINPVTRRVEARAAAEAIVQRENQPARHSAGPHVRGFAVVFFRWLEWEEGWGE